MATDPDVPTSLGLDEWLTRLAQPNGAPGGGSAAGVLLGTGAALLHMVCAYTPGDEQAAASAVRVNALRARALEASREDGIRSVALGAALASDGPGRSARVRDAARGGAASSADLCRIGLALTDELAVVAEVGNPHLVADTGVAAEALRAGIGAALINLRSNLDLTAKHSDDREAAAASAPLREVGNDAERARGRIDDLLDALPVG